MGLEKFNTNSKNARKTIFCDIDGTLVKFPDTFEGFKDLPKGKHKMKLLPGSLDKLWEWETSGYNIILTTGRKESMRPETEKQLREVGIFWDHLIMGLGPGPRYLVNDKNAGNDTAFAINVERNIGIGDIDINKAKLSVADSDRCNEKELDEYDIGSVEMKARAYANRRYNDAKREFYGEAAESNYRRALDDFNEHCHEAELKFIRRNG